MMRDTSATNANRYATPSSIAANQKWSLDVFLLACRRSHARTGLEYTRSLSALGVEKLYCTHTPMLSNGCLRYQWRTAEFAICGLLHGLMALTVLVIIRNR